MSSVKIVDTAT